MARAFDGSSVISRTNPTGFDTSAAWTCGFWVYRDNTTDWRGLLRVGGPAGLNTADRGFSLVSRAGGTFELQWAGGVNSTTGGGVITAATWYRVIAGYDPAAGVGAGLNGTLLVGAGTGDPITAMTAGDVISFGDPGHPAADGDLLGRVAGGFWIQGLALSAAAGDAYLQDLCSLIPAYGASGTVVANALKGLWLFQSGSPGQDISGVGNDLTNSGTTNVADPGGVPANCDVPVIEQEGYRFRNDDGSETTATFSQAQDTTDTISAGINKRLRVIVNSTHDEPSSQFRLEYKKSTDNNYTPVLPPGAF